MKPACWPCARRTLTLQSIRCGVSAEPRDSATTGAKESQSTTSGSERIERGPAARLERSRPSAQEQGWMSPDRNCTNSTMRSPVWRLRSSAQSSKDSRSFVSRYLELLDWTGRQLQQDKVGKSPPSTWHRSEPDRARSCCWCDVGA